MRIAAIERSNEAVAAERRGEIETSFEHARAAIAIDPGFARAHWLLGSMHSKAGHLADAERAFRDAVATMGEDRDPDYPYRLGVTLAALADAEVRPVERDALQGDALTQLGLALAIDPGHYKAHYRIGILLEARGADGDAASAYERSIAARPTYSAAYVALGILKIRTADRIAGMVVLERGLAINDADAIMWRGYGQGLHRTGDAAKALAAYDRAKAIDPDLVEIDVDRARALAELGREAEARAALKAFAERAPPNTAAATRRIAEALSEYLDAR